MRTIFVVDVELAEVPGLGGAAVAVRERAQRLQALGHRGREAALARQVRDQEDVLRRVHLVGAVRAACGDTYNQYCRHAYWRHEGPSHSETTVPSSMTTTFTLVSNPYISLTSLTIFASHSSSFITADMASSFPYHTSVCTMPCVGHCLQEYKK